MNCLFLRRCYPELTVDVTVTGTGNTSYCYATIGGTTVIAAGTYTVKAGDVITFGVSGTSSRYYGSVEIDGITVLTVTSSKKTYDWTVPDGISSINIALAYNGARKYGTITVTTA